MKKIIILLSIFLIYSCKTFSKKDIIVYPSINKKDSLLVINIENNTDLDLMIEYPLLNNFFYEDELEASTPEVLYMQKSFDLLKNDLDVRLNRDLKCKKIQDMMKIKENSIPKFIKKKSQKKYYLKIRRYRKGETIVFKDDDFDFIFNLLNDDQKNAISNIKNQNCGGYTYFTGSIKFYPDKIILP
ncbi:hypothetical protein NK356_21015 [Chryseobacterium sp. S0630]|uniref:hypothetical protein n=1 Tax=Chryseobacterium sp. S0630 TaxID=2957803 RepID=UPI00209F0B5A|nr:hypothetical protein [Chryseobacterium sp. S0630]MCP1301661.1 hypothetical protein [Chryseobacterium sp. S0630]